MKDENTNKVNEELLFKHELVLLEGILEFKSKYRKIIQAGIARWVKDFQDDRIEIDLELQKDEF
ncbi:hypothetical protein [Paenibacillus aceris]|uniref:Uncharacterized protein n=1 Tax=Paenibacillus aceris TaxID=869555 RepID=A0ABS4HRC9_9BACL|nr:hypothetical protein [Paenibacillus aceris]MBP1961174.1 hypothetical protein [Paenibacillus aceris]NHW39036.1 hypothetical protein [Paenibacillus aceris]